MLRSSVLWRVYSIRLASRRPGSARSRRSRAGSRAVREAVGSDATTRDEVPRHRSSEVTCIPGRDDSHRASLSGAETAAPRPECGGGGRIKIIQDTRIDFRSGRVYATKYAKPIAKPIAKPSVPTSDVPRGAGGAPRAAPRADPAHILTPRHVLPNTGPSPNNRAILAHHASDGTLQITPLAIHVP